MQMTRQAEFDNHPAFKRMVYVSTKSNQVGTGDLPESYYSKHIRALFDLKEPRLDLLIPPLLESNVLYYPNRAHASNTIVGSNGLRATPVPAEWPERVTGPCFWSFQDVQERQFILYLTKAHINEIHDAVRFVKALCLYFEAITMDMFPLPTLGPELLKIADIVYNSLGFSIIRGLDLGEFDPNDRVIVFLGLSSYVGEERGPQDRHGTMIKHIMDDERIESRNELPFHTDVTCDVSALLTVRCSDYGGMWTVASSFAVYNVLARDRPDLIHVLAKPDWPFDTFGRNPPFFRRALLYFEDGKIIFNFSRRLLAGHPTTGRSAGVPRLSKVQAEALDAVHFVAREHCLRINMEEGDIRFISNLSVLHGRDGFHDDDCTESRRYVMRLWLRNREKAWKLPSALRLAWARIFDDPSRRREWLVEPYVRDGAWHGRGLRAECD